MKYRVGLSDAKPNSSKSTSFNRKPVTGASPRHSVHIRSGNVSSGTHSLRPKKINLRTLGLLSRKSRKSNPKASKLGTNISGKVGKAKFKMLAARAFLFLMAVGFFGGLIGFLVLGLYLKSLQESLPDPDRLTSWNSDKSTIIYDRDGNELFNIFDGKENREFVSIDKIPDHTKWALLAAEDVEFYQHKGIDIKGILGCALQGVQKYLKGESTGDVCGASTISQQLVRNTIMAEVYGDEAYTRLDSGLFAAAQRKIREWLLTIQVERSFTKDEILQLYMNEVPLGGVSYGYGTASKAYFGKDVSKLDLAESAMLAGIIQSPSVHSPLVNPESAKNRQNYVFTQMLKYKDLTGATQEQVDAAKAEELVYKSVDIDLKAYHFIFYVKDYLIQKYGQTMVESGGLKVTTTLDMKTQKVAQEELVKGINQYGHKVGVYNGAVVILDPNTNQILAMIGSVDPNENKDKRIDGSVNVTTSLRQVGSSFKPYVYFTAFQKYGPWLAAHDFENTYNFGNYKVDNWDKGEMGLMNSRHALVQSRNIPTIYLTQLVGIESILQNVEKMGVTTLTNRSAYGLSLGLGAGEMKLVEHAQAYSVFATGGIYRPAEPLLKVEDSKGKVLYEYKKDAGKRIFDEKDVYLLNWTLCDLGKFNDGYLDRSGYYLINGQHLICGKTGTTNDAKDLLSMQYHKNLVVAVWSGNNNNKGVGAAWSSTVPAPIAHNIMVRLATKYKPELYTRPAGVLATTVCLDTGHVPSEGNPCKKISSIYVQGRAPAPDKREVIQVCKDTGKKSTNIPVSTQFGLLSTKWLMDVKFENALQQASLEKKLASLKDSSYLFKAPEEAECTLPLGPGNSPVVDITSPANSASVKPGDTITITATARAENLVDYVRFSFNGNLVPGGEVQNAPYTVNYTIPSNTPAGTFTIAAEVFDDVGRSGSDSISITVQSTATITITAPANGAKVNLPLNMTANVSGMVPDSVSFRVTGPNGYDKTFNGSGLGALWTGVWTNTGNPQAGSYQIVATAVKGSGASSTIITSPTITVTLQ